MATTAKLEPAAREIDPGVPAALTLSVSNDSVIVDAYALVPIGPAAEWIIVRPAQISVYPGKSETAVVTISAPRRSDVVAGEVAIGIRVVPVEQPDDATVAEATITVLPFTGIGGEIVPSIAQGLRSGKARLAVDNTGNAPLRASINGFASDKIDVTTDDPDVDIAPDRAQFVSARLRAREILWRGQPLSHPYRLVVAADSAAPLELAGTFIQRPVFPPWFWKAVIALLTLLALLVVLWFTLLKPAIESTAQEAIDGPIAEAQELAGSAAQQSSDAVVAANEAKEAVGQTPGPDPDPETASTRTPQTLRFITSSTVGNEDESDRWAVPENSIFKITDIVVSNPSGGSGTLTIQNAAANSPIMPLGIENFRDIDFHFVTSIDIEAGDQLFTELACSALGAPLGRTPTSCSVSTIVTGVLVTSAP